MANEVIISVESVSKAYRLWQTPVARVTVPLMERLSRLLPAPWRKAVERRAASRYRDFWALQDISFVVRRGESVGVLGRNGSGKSTLLQIVAGTLQPTTGKVRVNGRIAALLELGSGFNPEFTGRENVYLNGAVLGLSRREIDARFEQIANFADIGDFIDQPVKTYSSGMLVRLAFSVQVQVEPDILIIDEALAVGDLLFQKRCFEQMRRLVERGTTLLIVAHDPEMVHTMSSSALLIRQGRIRSIGPSAEVILDYRRETHEDERNYLTRVAQKTAVPVISPTTTTAAAPAGYGDMDAVIVGVRVLDGNLAENGSFRAGDPIVIEITYEVRQPLTRLNVGFRLRNKEGVKIYSGGTFANDINRWYRDPSAPAFWDQRFQTGERFVLHGRFNCILGPNLYEVQAFICEELERRPDHQRMIHWKDEAAHFMVTMDRIEYWFGGIADLKVASTVARLESNHAGNA